MSDATDDTRLLGGQLLLRQFRAGHRAGTDACLLAAAAEVPAGACLVDAGAGVGSVGLAVLCRVPDAAAWLVERDRDVATLARWNVDANGFNERAQVVEADLFDAAALERAGVLGRGDEVLTNPPFYDGAAVRPPADPLRSAAHVEERPIGEWMRAVARLGKPKARLVVIHRPAALSALLGAWPDPWGGFTLRSVHAYADRAAVRVIVSARRGSRAPLAVLPPLVLHQEDGRFTPAADAVHRGAALVPGKKKGPAQAGHSLQRLGSA